MAEIMDLTTKLRQKFVCKTIFETDWLVGPDTPLVVELDTTEVCNFACPSCISSDIVQKRNKFSNERLLQLAEEFLEMGVKAVVLIGGGEPLAHPAVGELIRNLGENDIHIGITTNGTYIRKHLDVIARYSKWTRVSMDAASSELFGRLRPLRNGKSLFGFIVNNMRMLAKKKKGKLGYSYLIQTEADGDGTVSNIHEIYKAAKLARDIGCDYFEVKPSYQFRNGVDHALMQHDDQLMEEATKEISRLDNLETKSFKILKAINLKYSLSCTQVNQHKDYHTCPAAGLRTLICPSGVFVCPYWRGKSQMKIGDINDNTFSSVWNGRRRESVMKYLDPSKHCLFYCLRHDSNQEVFNLIKLKDNNIQPDIIDEFDRFI